MLPELKEQYAKFSTMDNIFLLTEKYVYSITFQLAKHSIIFYSQKTSGKDWLKRFLRCHENTIKEIRPIGESEATAIRFNSQ